MYHCVRCDHRSENPGDLDENGRMFCSPICKDSFYNKLHRLGFPRRRVTVSLSREHESFLEDMRQLERLG